MKNQVSWDVGKVTSVSVERNVFETSVYIYQSTRRNISEDLNLQPLCCENRKSRMRHFAVKCTGISGINRLTNDWYLIYVGKLVVATAARVPTPCPCSTEILIYVQSCKEAEWFDC